MSRKLNLSIDLKWITVALAVVIVAMLFIWKPWATRGVGERTVEVTGDATITAKPDQYVFYPSYEFKNQDKAAALAALSQKSDEIVAKLKSLGVANNKIETNASGYDMPVYYDTDNKNATYTLQVTITVNDLKLAQKVQDYLVTTSPTGAVSPSVDFSDKMRRQLESQARDQSTKDARSKGEQMAKNLGFKLGKVKTIQDDTGFGDYFPAMSRGTSAAAAEDTSSLTVQPGENDFTYSVTVTYFIK